MDETETISAQAETSGAAPSAHAPAISVVIPFRNAAAHLEACLRALARSAERDYEVILVDDGSTDSSPEIARRCGGKLLSLPRTSGPACARNRGAAAAAGRILLFLDADVVCYPDTLGRVRAVLDADAGLAAVFGSYDDSPPARNFFSLYKNLTHHWYHQNARPEAATFWAGCGAVRREVFRQAGGFDERYARPSIEDIELGCRLAARGHRIRLCRELRVRHAKRWTLAGLLRSDIRDRALPWTMLLWSRRQLVDDLNLSRRERVAAFFSCLAALEAVLGLWKPWHLAGAALALVPVVACNHRLVCFYGRRVGWWFALRAAAMHWLYYLYSTTAFAVGTVLYWARRGQPQPRAGTPRAGNP